MALSSKEREKIIEEETLRFDTRRNLEIKYAAEKTTFWPWAVFGGLAVWLLYSWIFCGAGPGRWHCWPMHGGMEGHRGMMWEKPAPPPSPEKK